MARQYTLDTKIFALNQLDKYDGDLQLTSDHLQIPAKTLKNWRGQEADLRHAHQQKLKRQFARLKSDLQIDMLERGMQIVSRMKDDEVLDKAPLSQLASALSTLLNHALKLEEASDTTDEQQEQTVRFEFVSGDYITEVPPWTMEGTEEHFTIQDRRVRETLGQNGTREDDSTVPREVSRDAWMVAGSNLSDVESGLAGLEDDRQERDWYHD